MRTRCWVVGLVALFVCSMLLVAGCGSSSTSKPQQTLNVYTIWPEKYSSQVFEAFTQDTGIKVNFIRFSSGEALARIVAEKDNPQVDVLFGGPADTFAAGISKNVFEPYTPKYDAAIPAKYKDANHYWTGVAVDPLCFMTNAKFLKKHNLQEPTSWQDLLNPVYTKGLQMADARTSGTAISRILSLNSIMGEDASYVYQKKLHQNVQLYTKSGGGGCLPIANGQAAGGIFFLVDAMEMKQQGYDVVISYPEEGVVYAVEAMGLIKGAKQPELAKQFLDWASSKNMQKLYESKKLNYVPADPEIKLSDPAMDVSNVKLIEVDIAKAGADRERLVDRWINEVVK